MIRGRDLACFVLGATLVAETFGCSIDEESPAGTPKQGVASEPLNLDTVEWTRDADALGTIRFAVAAADGQLVVFSSRGMFVVSGGAITATNDSISSWTAASALPAADGRGTWAVGVDDAGVLYRAHADGRLEPISARYGLADAKVWALASAASPATPGAVAFAIEGQGVAFSDGTAVQRYAVDLEDLSAAPWRVAGVTKGLALTLTLEPSSSGHEGKAARIPVLEATRTAFDGDRLVIATPRALGA